MLQLCVYGCLLIGALQKDRNMTSATIDRAKLPSVNATATRYNETPHGQDCLTCGGRRSLNPSTMSPFSMFALLYMTAYFVEVDPAGHEAQGMQGQIFALASVLVITTIILTGITRVKFLVFLVLATAILLIDRFPDVPNHVNIMIYCNILLIVAMIYSFARYRGSATDNHYFEMIRPVLRASLILIYCLAGFHKLNSDFLNPQVSCAGAMLSRVLGVGSLVTSNIFSASAAVVLAAGALFVLWKRISGTYFVAPRLQVYTLLLVLCAGV